LPPVTVAPVRAAGRLPPVPLWRYAAMFAAALIGAALLYRTGVGRGPDATELAGTMAGKAARTGVIVDTVQVDLGQVTGRVRLYRSESKLGLDIALAAAEPVDVLVASGGEALRIAGPRAVTTLPGPWTPGQTVDLSFVVHGRQVGTAQLRVPPDR